MSEPSSTPSRSYDLSPLGQQVLKLNLDSAYTALVCRGAGDAEARRLLDGVTPQQVLSAPVRDEDDAAGVLSGLWLWHDRLAESHRIAQAIDTPNGSFWHAIMHRREGDFGNSRYWYDRVATDHPLWITLAAQADAIINPLPADKSLLRLAPGGRWNPRAFVDLVEQIHDRPDDPRHPAAVSLQQLEWRVLFDFCKRRAGGI